MHQDLYQKDMETTACVYEEQTAAIHELTQGIQMTQQLMVNLHSPEARDFFIKKILSSYENALFVLRSGASAGQPWTSALPAPGLPESSVLFNTSPGSEIFGFNQHFSVQQEQNVNYKKRKVSTTWEDHDKICSEKGLEDNTDESYNQRKYGQKEIFVDNLPGSYYRCSYPKLQKCLVTKQVQMIDEKPTVTEIAYKTKLTYDQGAPSAAPPPPLEKHEMVPTQHLQQLSALNPDEMLLSGDIAPSSFSIPSASFGLQEDLHRFQFPNQYFDELLSAYSPSFIAPEWESSLLMDVTPIWQM